MYTSSSTTIKCPFFKRRIADTIDNVAMITRFLIIRHKSLWPSLDIAMDMEFMQAPGCKAIGRHIQTNADGTSIKHKLLPLETILQIIVHDWSPTNHKGYYITGKLNSTIYRDDCLFDGPDPDMPVRGVRKYLGAASNLFDSSQSFATMLNVEIVEKEDKYKVNHRGFGGRVIQVRWSMEGVLMLPWRPKVKPLSGWTKYYVDEEGLIAYHEEGWDISVMEAFVGTILPEVGDRIWGERPEGVLGLSSTVQER